MQVWCNIFVRFLQLLLNYNKTAKMEIQIKSLPAPHFLSQPVAPSWNKWLQTSKFALEKYTVSYVLENVCLCIDSFYG